MIRTIDTAEAFKLKIKLLKDELAEKKEEASRLESSGVFTSAGGGLLKFLRALAYAIFTPAIIIFIIANTSPDAQFQKGDIVTSGIIAFKFFTIGFILRNKGKKLVRDAKEKSTIADENRRKLLTEMDILESEIKRQEAIIQEHMLNQHELLDLEVKAITQFSRQQEVECDTKDYPMCAETIKAKAEICRNCNYSFPDTTQ